MSAWDRHGREGVAQAGTFTVGSHDAIFGTLTLDRRNSKLELRDQKDFHSGYAINGYTYIQGTMHDLAKVSLLKCVMREGLGRTTRGQESYYHARFSPSFALFGDVHLLPEDKSVCEVSFFVDDASTLFYDFGTFGSVLDARKYIDVIAGANTEFDSNITRHVIGPEPEILYFTGKREICTANTSLGSVTATHNLRKFFPNVEGVKIESAVSITISFPEPCTFDDTISAVTILLRFIELCIGRPQRMERLVLSLPERNGVPVVLDVYWTYRPWREVDDNDAHPGDALVDPIQGISEYSAVLAAWLRRNAEWQDARVRFSMGFNRQGSFSIDRLVGAANMFDILPPSAAPAHIELTEEITAARDQAQRTFKRLGATYERDQILGALGRLGKPSLKHKIRYRAQMVLDKLDAGHVPGLLTVCDAAVDCRNHYVHGTVSKIDYSKHFDLLVFLTDTLEFVFGSSDLVESGWDFRRWYDGVRGMSHPFGKYLLNYPVNLQLLLDLTK